MPTPAPKARRPERGLSNSSSSNWTTTFLGASALRTRPRAIPAMWMLTVCAILPIGLWSRSQADSRAAESIRTSSQHEAVTVLSATTAASPTTPSSSGSSTASQTTGSGAPGNSAPVVQVPVERPLSLRVIVSGQQFRQTITLPPMGRVSQALDAMGIKLNHLDRVNPVAGALARDGMTIKVTRVTTSLQKRRIYTAFGLRYKPTSVIERGAQQVVQTGKPGIIEVTERVWVKDGKVTLHEFVSRRTVDAGRDQILALGARDQYIAGNVPYHNRYAQAYALSARGGSPRDRMMAVRQPETLRALQCISVIATGYSADPRENGGYTSTCTGLPIGYGAAAVDPRVIPLGSKLYVEGYGYAFACDTGGAIKGNRIDLAYDSYRVANDQGRRRVRVWILGQ